MRSRVHRPGAARRQVERSNVDEVVVFEGYAERVLDSASCMLEALQMQMVREEDAHLDVAASGEDGRVVGAVVGEQVATEDVGRLAHKLSIRMGHQTHRALDHRGVARALAWDIRMGVTSTSMRDATAREHPAGY